MKERSRGDKPGLFTIQGRRIQILECSLINTVATARLADTLTGFVFIFEFVALD